MFYHSFLLKIQVENLCFVNWTAGLAYHVYNYVVISHLWACLLVASAVREEDLRTTCLMHFRTACPSAKISWSLLNKVSIKLSD